MTLRSLLGAAALVTLLLPAKEYSITVQDEGGAPLPGATVSALFSRTNDPRLSSMKDRDGKTGPDGVFRCEANEDMCLVRLRASSPGRFAADVTEVHGLNRFPSQPTHVITLPKETEGIPLCYKDVRINARAGNLPQCTWVGYDLAMGDVVAPWGRGETADLRFWNEGKQVGWRQPEDAIAELRKDKDLARMSEAEFSDLFGTFRGVTRVVTGKAGDGLVRSKSYWPYCWLKMPAEAPDEGYGESLELPYPILPTSDLSDEPVGYYLRVRTKLTPDGKVASAHYAKIQGGIRTGQGWVEFRYYYNPRPNDRRLALDVKQNLLQPRSGMSDPEETRYRPFEP